MDVLELAVALVSAVAILSGSVGAADGGLTDYATNVTRLTTGLLAGYDTAVPPQRASGDQVSVRFGVGLVSIEHLDENTGVLTSHVWLRYLWNDYRLTWDSTDNDGITEIRLPYKQIWRPDIVPYNKATTEFEFADETLAVVYHDGTVLLIPHVRLHTSCALDLHAFPFDTQRCAIKFGSWVYAADVISLGFYEGKKSLDLSDYMANSKWDLLDNNATISEIRYPCCDEPYTYLTVWMSLRRRAHLLMSAYIGPAICTSLVAPAVFILPADSSHKMVLGGVLLISQTIVTSTFVQSLPDNHFSVPTLVTYLLGNIVLLSLSLACAAVVVYCWKRADRGGTGVPFILEKIFLGVLARCLCVSQVNFVREDRRDSVGAHAGAESAGTEVKDYRRQGLPAEWRQLSAVLDRLFFIVFLTAAVITLFSLAGAHAYNY